MPPKAQRNREWHASEANTWELHRLPEIPGQPNGEVEVISRFGGCKEKTVSKGPAKAQSDADAGEKGSGDGIDGGSWGDDGPGREGESGGILCLLRFRFPCQHLTPRQRVCICCLSFVASAAAKQSGQAKVICML